MKAMYVTKETNLAKYYGMMGLIRRALAPVGFVALLISFSVSWKLLWNTISAIGYYNFKGVLYELIISLIILAMIIRYLMVMLKGRDVRKIKTGMNVPGFFSPTKNDEQIMPGNLQYVGLDFNTGMIGIGSVYQRGGNHRKVLYFPCEVIEHYHYEGKALILALKNRNIPELKIQMLQARVFERKIEQASHMVDVFVKGRNTTTFKEHYNAMLKADALIEADY